MPMVGIVTARVMRGGHGRRNRLEHDGETAGAFERQRVVEQALGFDRGASLRLVAAQQIHRLRRQPDVAHHRNAGVDQGADARRLGPAPSTLTASTPASLTKRIACATRLVGHLERSERHVGDDERALGAADDGARQHQHLVDRHRHGRIVPEHRHRRGIADQDDVDAGGVGQASARRVVGRDHAMRLAALFHER